MPSDRRARRRHQKLQAIDRPVVGPPAPVDPPFESDEGSAILQLDANTVVNIDPRFYESRRRELHLRSKEFSHVGETPAGHWTYRHDA